MPTPLPFDAFTARVLEIYSTGKHAPSTLGHIRQIL